MRRSVRLTAAVAASAALLAACGSPGHAPAEQSPSASSGFRGVDCNGVTDDDITKAVGSAMFEKAVVSDTGCFWQENTMLGTFGAGMGISTWWYRGSDMDTERTLEQNAGRTLTELSIDGNKGFKAADTNVCSIYVAKGGDVITWSIQTMNPAALPDLCTIIEQLAQLSQDRVN
ncbi:DUF3558 domain-containing protein [Mycolicibacterium goodii]|uniref:DUF3558 domain-containing protein n=1 Tax=Mycolicibacterium goodii TaxID=134601 RepID=UPI001BDC95A5|nr:DUF3558 domain-containing protein [Mycolicibacterium goodii]MBU8815775.1 DUF3558 domain-containing protein [Mycolicibacterium goodii]